ncbi:MAG: glycoside hydrolase family 78 protein [Planctomycetota bacterium]
MRFAVAILALPVLFSAAPAGDTPDTPRIASVEMLKPQPHEKDKAVIWYDDFNGAEKKYAEGSGGVDAKENFGGPDGRSMPCVYEKGKRGRGGRKVFFGDSPYRCMVRKGEKFDEVYWRIYVKHQPGWRGNPAKMSRATSLVSGKWQQAMIAHVWGGKGDLLTLDPASGVRGDRVVTTKYNDFPNLKWLGNRPAAKFPIHGTAESGWWVCVESRAKLNTPGRKDGENQLWIDGAFGAERKNLDWRGRYAKHGINAVFLEAYWNDGSPVTQTRWYDNFVVSTKPIGPVVAPRAPVLYKTPYSGPGKAGEWEVEVASDREGKKAVWKSGPVRGKDSVKVGRKLAADRIHCVRVRQRSAAGAWSDWSAWHQPFRTAKR